MKGQKELDLLVNFLENPSGFGCGVFWWSKTCGLLMNGVRVDIELVNRLRSFRVESVYPFSKR